jgi:hypothetical protein
MPQGFGKDVIVLPHYWDWLNGGVSLYDPPPGGVVDTSADLLRRNYDRSRQGGLWAPPEATGDAGVAAAAPMGSGEVGSQQGQSAGIQAPSSLPWVIVIAVAAFLAFR